MQDEKDMIEINLNTPPALEGKETNYFGNIRFARANRGFPYGLQEDDEETTTQMQRKSKGYASFCDAAKFITSDDGSTQTISCLRQMYCPTCQQRLDADGVHFEKLIMCCLPLFPFSCIYENCTKRRGGRKVICNKCGSNLGYWKRS